MSYKHFLRGQQIALSLVYLAFLLKQFFDPDPPLLAAPVHVFMALAVVYVFRPQEWSSAIGTGLMRLLDVAIVVACLLICWHFYRELERLETRLDWVDEVFFEDRAVFVVGTLIVLEGVRRTVGWSLLSVIALFLAYAFFGAWAPGWIGFSGFSLPDMTEIITMNTAGLFGVTARTAVNFVFYFVMFGAIFSATGGGKVFIDIAMLVTGRLKGGAAKASLVGSALFGTISGSAVANVTSTGVLTIPLMRRSGYNADQAAATEAIASTGGQLMPPIMGVSAFVMADILGVPYTRIALAGIIPALAFYFALFMIIDLRARRSGIGNVDPKSLKIDPVAPRAHLLLSPAVLLTLLFIGYSAPFSAFYASVAALIVPMLRASTRYDLKRLFHIALEVPRQMANVSVPLAAVGIIMAVAMQSNLALKFVTQLAAIGGTNLYLSLLMVIIGCVIMGMGLPTVAAYIIGSVMFVPALVDLGVDRLAAHFFVMYYSVLSMVTPPVALCSYAAAGLAESDTTKTGLMAFGLGLVMFMIPLGFVNDITLLWSGTAFEIATAFIGMMIATLSWAVFIQNWFKVDLNILERLMFLVICFGLVLLPSHSLPWYGLCGAFAVLAVWCGGIRPKLQMA